MSAITPDAYPKPYDCRQADTTVTNAESGAWLTAPTTVVSRIVYALLFKDTAGAANDITIRVYNSDGILQTTLTRRVAANDDKFIGVGIDFPIITLQPGWYLTVQDTGNGSHVFVDYYDVR